MAGTGGRAMNRNLPEPLLDKAERLARSHGFDSIEAYLQDLMDRDEPHSFAGREIEVEALLLEGLASGPAEPFTKDDWDELKRRVDETHARLAHEGDSATLGQK
jgi:hypothetical protein